MAGLIPIEDLRRILDFCPDTGRLTWKEHVSRRCRAGMEAFTATEGHGYKHGKIYGRGYKAHRVIWALAHGKWPDHDIDHVNGDRADNRLCNLREATRSENLCNTAMRSNNTSGFKGVSRCKKTGRWAAYVKFNSERKFLGSFATPEEAHKEYVAAALQLHGEFASNRRTA